MHQVRKGENQVIKTLAMLPNEILPAIPRQKVKYVTGEIGEVLCTCQSELVEFEDQPDDSVMVRNSKTGRNDCWQIEDCEPVPEEPRGFRCGDNVKCKNLFTTILEIATFDDGKNVYVLANGGQAEEKDLRHPSPEEIARYF
jgi:hypothetical protein